MINEGNNTESQANDSQQIPSRELLFLSILSASTYLLLAFLIFRYVHGENLHTAFQHGYSISFQFIIGILSGGITAGIIGFIIKRPPVAEILNDFYIVEMISKMRLTHFDRSQLSVFAGVGEELLFRGALQPLLGIWVTSVIFIGIHGYFKFTSIGHILFGLLMFILSMILGYLFEYVGLITAMTAHAIYDVIMLKMVQPNR